MSPRSHSHAVPSKHLHIAQSHPSGKHVYMWLYGNTSEASFGYMLALISPLLSLAASWEGAKALIHDQY